jgi:hypothetical protein
MSKSSVASQRDPAVAVLVEKRWDLAVMTVGGSSNRSSRPGIARISPARRRGSGPRPRLKNASIFPLTSSPAWTQDSGRETEITFAENICSHSGENCDDTKRLGAASGGPCNSQSERRHAPVCTCVARLFLTLAEPRQWRTRVTSTTQSVRKSEGHFKSDPGSQTPALVIPPVS